MIVGVIGHRILTEIPLLEQAADQVFARLARLEPGKPWQMLSSLAEGADTLLVERCWLARPSARLKVVLPLPVADYRQDFKTPESQAVFEKLLGQAQEVLNLPPAPSRTAAYLAAGLWLVEQADWVIALWDGRPPQGEGSTAGAIAHARRLGKPLFIIQAGNRLPGTRHPTSLGGRQGKILCENFAFTEG